MVATFMPSVLLGLLDKISARIALLALPLAVLAFGIACIGPASEIPARASATEVGGDIEVDGSSTVFPITEAVAEEFRKRFPDVQVNVGVSGTGGGFKRFIAGETDINNASRPIKPSEAETAAANAVEYLEIEIAIDGLSVMVSPENEFVDCLTVQQLSDIWEPSSSVDSWNDVNPTWPDTELRLYGPGTDSGTFDYFTEVIVGEAQASRPDYTASEDDNVLVQGIGGDRNALGYLGYAYYAENKDRLKLVSVDGGEGCVLPSETTIQDGSYQPLARSLLIYVNKARLARLEVKGFLEFYMENGGELAVEVGYVALPPEVYLGNLALLK
jgi:phosphate transport system substrate-binding protein